MSRITDVAAALIPRIIEDAYFIAEQVVLMPGIVTNFTASGTTARSIGRYDQGTAAEVGEGSAVGSYSHAAKSVAQTLTPKTAQIEDLLTDDRVNTDEQDAAIASSRRMGLALGRKIDKDLVDVFASANIKKGNAGSAVTIATAAAAISVLRKNNTPNPIYAVWHPYHWHDVWVELGQPVTQKAFLGDVANEAMRDYYVGDFLGAMHLIDSNIDKFGGTAGTAHSGIFHPLGIALDTRTPITFESIRVPAKRATEIVGYVQYGVGENQEEHLAAVIGDVTEPA